MQSLKVKDNQSIKQSEFNKIPSLKDRIEHKSLEQLEKEGIFVFPELLEESERQEG